MSRQRMSILSALVLVCALSVCPAFGEGRWRPLPTRTPQQYALGLVGGEGEQHMHSIARSPSDPDIIYLSHDCGQIWRSDNNGLLWHKPECEGMHVKAGQSIEVDPVKPNIVLAVIDSSSNYISRPHEGVFRSIDYGESWELVLQADSQTQRTYQHCITYDPTSVTLDGAQRWYVAVPANGLFRSEDAGNSWTKIVSLTAHANVYSAQAHLTNGQNVYLGTSGGLYLSVGMTLIPWGDLPAGAITCIAMHPTDPDTLYVALLDNGLYRSGNGGLNFTLVRSGDVTGVFLNPGFPDTIYLSSLSSDLVVSHNAGATWQTPTVFTAPGFESSWKDKISGAQTGISPDPRDDDEAVCFSHGTITRTENGGVSFIDSSGLFTGNAWGWFTASVSYDVADSDRFAFFCYDVGLLITHNGGLSWDRHTVPWSWYTGGQVSWRGQYAGSIYPQTGSQAIVSSIGMYFDTKLLRTTDEGSNYTIVSNAAENHLFVAHNTDSPNIVYAGNKRSTNGGATFTAIPYLDQYDASIMGMCRAQPNTVYAMARPREMIFRSDDAGVTWRLYTSPGWRFNRLDSKPLFAIDPVDPDKIYTFASNNRDLATFDGVTWTTLPVLAQAGSPPYGNSVNMVCIDPRYPNIIYAGMFAAGYPQMFRSVDSGMTWEDITHNLPQMGTRPISVHPLTGDVMTSGCAGTWVYPPPYASANSIYPNCPGAPPIARAGDDFTVADDDGDGFALIPLDGTASTAPDTGIVDYQWTSETSFLGQGATTLTALGVGVHTVTLLVTDGDGVQDEDTVIITVTATTPGDADGDGDVDLDDFVILKQNFGMPAGASPSDGDFDGDEDVDLDDFVILKTNFGV